MSSGTKGGWRRTKQVLRCSHSASPFLSHSEWSQIYGTVEETYGIVERMDMHNALRFVELPMLMDLNMQRKPDPRGRQTERESGGDGGQQSLGQLESFSSGPEVWQLSLQPL